MSWFGRGLYALTCMALMSLGIMGFELVDKAGLTGTVAGRAVMAAVLLLIGALFWVVDIIRRMGAIKRRHRAPTPTWWSPSDPELDR